MTLLISLLIRISLYYFRNEIKGAVTLWDEQNPFSMALLLAE